MASPFTITSVSNYNSNPPSDDGAQTAANRVQWSTQKSKLADPIKTAFDTSETNTSNAFGKVVGGAGITTTAVDYTVTASDQGKLVKCTVSGKTITTPDATVVGSPFVFFVSNVSTGSITLDGNGAQTVDGAATITMPPKTGLMLTTDGSNWFTAGQSTLTPANFPNFLSGLILSTAGGSSTMSISAGAANDSTNTILMILSSAISKTTASWAVGTGNGGLDTGSIANSTWYHFFEIYRPDTGVVDILFSVSASSPTLPANYTLFRRIGSGRTDGSAHWLAFTQTGDTFIWATANADVTAGSTTSANRSTQPLTVATGVIVTALFRAVISVSAGSTRGVLFTSLQETDQTVAAGPAFSDLFVDATGSTTGSAAGDFARLTNTSAQIGVRSNTATNLNFSIGTYGWIDTRGKQ